MCPIIGVGPEMEIHRSFPLLKSRSYFSSLRRPSGSSMEYRSVLQTFVILTGIVGLLVTLCFTICDEKRSLQDFSLAYKLLPPVVDPEHRTEHLDDALRDETLDLSAFVGMPDEYRDLVSEYVRTVCRDIDTGPLMRKRYYHQNGARKDKYSTRDPFPDDANPIFDGEIMVPLAVLPRPEVVNKWTTSSEATAIGWRSIEGVFDNVGSVFGRTLIFEPGERSEEPHSLPAAPFEASIPSWSDYVPEFDFNVSFFLPLQKIVVQPFYHGRDHPVTDGSDDLRLGEEGGAVRLGELLTVPVYIQNTRLRWLTCTNGTDRRKFLAYTLVDGNGAKRAKKHQDFGAGPVSPYVRRLICERHQPRIKQHDLLLLPTPMAWPPNLGEVDDNNAHEEWCFDDWFPAQKDSCWVIRETADSKPLQESFVLMPASEKSDRPVFFVALFAETEPAELVQELSALYQVSPQELLNSPEKMERLQSLYEKVRTFPLDR